MKNDKIEMAVRGITPIGRVMLRLKVYTAWIDGYSVSVKANYWNPLALVITFFAAIIACFMIGIPQTIEDKHLMGIGLSDYWIKNKDKRIFVTNDMLNKYKYKG